MAVNKSAYENEMMQKDPLGKSAKDPGSKLDKGKSPVMQGALQYFPRALLAIADLSQKGANRYSWKGWEKVPDGVNRYGNAAGRHLLKEQIEGEYDRDPDFTDVLHATQVAWNDLARLELILREKEEKPSPLLVQKASRPWERGDQMDPVDYDKIMAYP